MSACRLLLLLSLFALLTGCSNAGQTQIVDIPTGGGAMQLTSPAFTEGAMIPARNTCDGVDLSPALAWSGTPEGTKAFALIMDDPDAPVGVWVHWVLFNLPASLTALPEAIPADPSPAVGGMHGANSWRRTGYGGPCPPSGTHRYFFKLYALDTPLAGLNSQSSARDVEAALRGHILAQAQLMGRYSRK